VDLADEASVVAFYEGAGTELWASVHLAGGFVWGPIVDAKLADLRRMLAMNVESAWLCAREAARRMKQGGRIVNVAAKPALVPAANVAAYAASKGAVATFTTCLAEELAPRGIWVNAVAPSILDTPANRAAMPDADFDAWPKVEEVARTIVFLASPENAVMRGAIVPVYGRS
jgi:NAD(P)-dependent dehydrogenase (short-subunit alcohol dehydrogenase family)